MKRRKETQANAAQEAIETFGLTNDPFLTNGELRMIQDYVNEGNPCFGFISQPTIYNGWGLAKARVVIKALKKTGLDFTVYTKGKKVYIDIR